VAKDTFKEYLLRFFGSKFDEADLELAKYRWKFLRENYEFKNDFCNFKKDLEARLEEKGEAFEVLPSMDEISFYKKWKLGESFLSLVLSSTYEFGLESSFDDFYLKSLVIKKYLKLIGRRF